VQVAAFGKGQRWLVEALREEQRADPETLRIYLAWCDGEPAAVGWARLRAGRRFASLWGGGTRPSMRRRGLYTALVATRVQEARARGHAHALVDAGPMSRPILEHLGFRELVRMHPHRLATQPSDDR
jgi:GNAT superfamily N-acetyltransferase